MPEIRQNRLTGEWVIIAPERAKRGTNLVRPPEAVEIPPCLATCPFCPGNEGPGEDERFRIPGPDGRWLFRSVINKFSVLSPAGTTTPDVCAPSGQKSVNGVGLHEVLIEAPEHHLTLAQMPLAQVQRVFESYRQRFDAFYADPRIRHVIIFKNHGADAGASQQHPHSQIVGLPIIPGQVVDRLHRSRKHHAEKGQCLACTLIAQEREQACRIVAETSNFVAFIPYAALSPYHLWIFPKVHSPCFSDLPAEQLPDLAAIVHTILIKLFGYLKNPPFNLVVRSLAPRDDDDALHFHWYISIVPRVNKVAGFELGTGMYVNPSSPEICAQALRDFCEA
jgi:UDPglucose--hexose-1-phosphate uridylyltransferase